MVKLVDEDIKTREVLDWKGLHVCHMALSSCSQKLRIFLALKGLKWESHEVNLMASENLSEWFRDLDSKETEKVVEACGVIELAGKKAASASTKLQALTKSANKEISAAAKAALQKIK